MRRVIRFTCLPFVALIAAGFLLCVAAQAPQAGANANAPSDGTKKVLTLADYGKWNRVTSTALSPDGKWMSYAYQPNTGDQTLFVKQLDGDKLYTIPIGSAAGGGGRGGAGGPGGGGGGGGPQFSDDSRWIGYFVNPPATTGARGAGRAGAPGGTPGGAPGGGRGGAGARGAAGAAATERPTRHFELLELATGERTSIPNPASFRFSKGSHWLAVRLSRAAGADTSFSGADLVLRDLSSGMNRNIGNVNLYEFDSSGTQLAYTVDAQDKIGNGLYLLQPATGETRVLATAANDFDALSWSAEGLNLAVLRGEKKKENKQKDNILLAWTSLGSAAGAAVQFDPSKADGFPNGKVLSEFATPQWTKDGSKIFVGIKEQEPEPPTSNEPQANVDVWHWKDAVPQSEQMIRLAQDRRATLPAAFVIASKQFVVLGDDDMRSVTPVANGFWGIGRNDAAYRGEVSEGGTRADYYRVNMWTGERTLISKGLTRTMGSSPDGKWFLYLKDKHVHAFNLENAKDTVIDAKVGKSFVDEQDDHPAEKPTYGVAGWTKDGNSVLLYHRYDIWQLSLDGGAAVNLTKGKGDADEVRFRLVRLDAGARGGRGGGGGGGGRGGGGGEEEGIDLSKPQLLSAYGEWTKKSGYYTLVSGQEPKPLIWVDKQIGQAEKAKSADRVIFTQQSFTEFPDWWVTNSAFEAPRKITDANPFITDYLWGSRTLIDFKNSKGQRLQATLTLPANYEQGKKYPMLVYIYEQLSNTHHAFSMPVYDDRPHMSAYASDGYLVLQPDIVYEIGKPGLSALDCVTAAVKKVIELGYADPKHIGLQGHSWGGYESSFILTQTDIFAAVVTGAPLTDLTSMYDEVYKQTGSVNQGILEMGQGRWGANVNPWTAHDLLESQSPVHQVTKITTPFLILQGTADGAVDWDQGLEYFNAARRNGKQVIFLSYPDEPHHLAKEENQKDFQIRMKQFFDHYLKGTPAPQWMTEGVPQTKKGGPIK
jgi:dipeptidyl aminopeptidase/acylaminoacyl peptidase